MVDTGRNVFLAEETNSDVTVDRPLLRLTVWLAAVVHKSGSVPLRTSVYHPVVYPTRSS